MGSINRLSNGTSWTCTYCWWMSQHNRWKRCYVILVCTQFSNREIKVEWNRKCVVPVLNTHYVHRSMMDLAQFKYKTVSVSNTAYCRLTVSQSWSRSKRFFTTLLLVVVWYFHSWHYTFAWRIDIIYSFNSVLVRKVVRKFLKGLFACHYRSSLSHLFLLSQNQNL